MFQKNNEFVYYLRFYYVTRILKLYPAFREGFSTARSAKFRKRNAHPVRGHLVDIMLKNTVIFMIYIAHILLYYDTYTYKDYAVLYKSLPDRRLPTMGISEISKT